MDTEMIIISNGLTKPKEEIVQDLITEHDISFLFRTSPVENWDTGRERIAFKDHVILLVTEGETYVFTQLERSIDGTGNGIIIEDSLDRIDITIWERFNDGGVEIDVAGPLYHAGQVATLLNTPALDQLIAQVQENAQYEV